jgi:hypothetical protein
MKIGIESMSFKVARGSMHAIGDPVTSWIVERDTSNIYLGFVNTQSEGDLQYMDSESGALMAVVLDCTGRII